MDVTAIAPMVLATMPTALLAIGCGMLTTLAGQGGGMVLLIGLAALHGPTLALQLSAPALLVGNAHRLVAMRASLDRPLALRLAGGAIVGSALGGALAMQIPRGVLLAAMLGIVALGVGKRLGLALPTPNPRWLALWTLGTGAVCAVGGGAGMIVAPLLMALGLRGNRYVATAAAVAVAMHIGRALGYSAGGGLGAAVWLMAVPVALGLVAGNTLALPLRRRLASERLATFEVCTLVAVAGAALLQACRG